MLSNTDDTCENCLYFENLPPSLFRCYNEIWYLISNPNCWSGFICFRVVVISCVVASGNIFLLPKKNKAQNIELSSSKQKVLPLLSLWTKFSSLLGNQKVKVIFFSWKLFLFLLNFCTVEQEQTQPTYINCWYTYFAIVLAKWQAKFPSLLHCEGDRFIKVLFSIYEAI